MMNIKLNVSKVIGFIVFSACFITIICAILTSPNTNNIQKTILIHYINGDIVSYNRNSDDIKVLSHLSLLRIHNASYPDVTYIPFHNIKFFMITDNKTIISDSMEK